MCRGWFWACCGGAMAPSLTRPRLNLFPSASETPVTPRWSTAHALPNWQRVPPTHHLSFDLTMRLLHKKTPRLIITGDKGRLKKRDAIITRIFYRKTGPPVKTSRIPPVRLGGKHRKKTAFHPRLSPIKNEDLTWGGNSNVPARGLNFHPS